MIVIKFGGSVLYELHPSIIEDIHKISLNEKNGSSTWWG